MSEVTSPGGSKRPRSPIRKVTVAEVARLTPALTRVTFAGSELAGFGPPRPASHIKLHMAGEGTRWDPQDESQPRPPRRTYTPRSFDPAGLRLDVDFVLHGHGLASDWAAQAAVGQTMFVSGPGGGYDVPADAAALVMVADDTALPAAAMVLEALPAGCRPVVLAEVAGPDEERALSARVTASPSWLHRAPAAARPGALLEEAVRTLALPPGPVSWWIACEAGAMRRIKQHLIRERGVEPARLHTRGYWKLGETAYPDHDYGKD